MYSRKCISIVQILVGDYIFTSCNQTLADQAQSTRFCCKISGGSKWCNKWTKCIVCLKIIHMSIMLHALMSWAQQLFNISAANVDHRRKPSQDQSVTVADGLHIRSSSGVTPDVCTLRYGSATEQLSLISFLFLYRVPVSADGCWAGLCVWKQLLSCTFHFGTVKMIICLEAISKKDWDVNRQAACVCLFMQGFHQKSC